MGVYNTYNGHQMKVGDKLSLASFEIGDEVDIEDGIYLTEMVFLIVHEGILIAEYDMIVDKWGNEHSVGHNLGHIL